MRRGPVRRRKEGRGRKKATGANRPLLARASSRRGLSVASLKLTGHVCRVERTRREHTQASGSSEAPHRLYRLKSPHDLSYVPRLRSAAQMTRSSPPSQYFASCYSTRYPALQAQRRPVGLFGTADGFIGESSLSALPTDTHSPFTSNHPRHLPCSLHVLPSRLLLPRSSPLRRA
jgi:hypothetical protein